MLDRIWWIWQMQDPEKRVNLVPGSGSMQMNMKRDAAKDIIVDLNWTAGPVKLMDINNALGGLQGEMCYIYV